MNYEKNNNKGNKRSIGSTKEEFKFREPILYFENNIMINKTNELYNGTGVRRRYLFQKIRT